MTFNQMALKIFKANIRRYLLYFICSSFTVMVFFTYSTLLTNKNFMNPYKVNKVISNNLIAPSIVIVIFSIFFIIYTQSSFIKFRKTEFGLFMVLGMTDKNIRRIILFENSIIAFISIIAGLLAGTLFSGIFYFIIMKIINIEGIPFSLTPESYLFTIIFFVSIYLLVISSNLILSLSYNIINLLKESRKEDRNRINGTVTGLIGIVAIGIAFYDMVSNFKTENTIVFLRSVSICFIGMYLVISNLVSFLTKVLKLSLSKYYKNMLFIANLKYTFGQSKKILFLISLLVGITIFFSSIALVITSDSEEFAVQHNPYHIAYVEVYGKNSISEDSLNNIIKTGETPLTSYKHLEYINKLSIKIFSDKDFNSVLGTSFQIQEGHFINLFQIVENDGYAHNTSEIKKIDVKIKSGNSTFFSQGSITEMLFNNIPIMASGHYLIVNNKDYLAIKAAANSLEIGRINLMSFKDWKKTKTIVIKLTTILENYNKVNSKQYFDNINHDVIAFRPASRIGEYLERKQSGSFLMFLLAFVGILFYVSSGVILHFRLLTEIEREKEKYKKLHKVGITRKEVAKMISKELIVLFFLPYILGMLFATFYIDSLLAEGGKVMASTSYILVLSVFYLSIQLLYYIIYKRVYIKKFLLYK